MCSGRVDPDIILEAFNKGVDGVFVGGCHFGDCHYQKGNYQAEDKMWVTKKLLKIINIEPERLRLEWVSATEGELFAKLMTEFTEEIKELGPLKLDDDTSLDIKAIKKECSDFRLRWLVGKKRAMTELGNVYNEKMDAAEIERMFDDIIRTDFIRNKILILTEQTPSSVDELAEKLSISTDEVFRNIERLSEMQKLALSEIKGATPVYKAIPYKTGGPEP
jgi:coenzyme F420-reducing hydrogenase delta subunit